MLKITLRKKNIHKIKKFAVKGAKVLVGFPSGIPHEGGIELAELACTLSVGTAHIPARPFLDDGLASQKEAIQAEQAAQARALLKTGKANYHKIGVKAASAIQDFVRGGHYKSAAPNAPATIRRKTKKGKKKGEVQLSDKPLIDTAEMIKSLHYVIIEDSSITMVKMDEKHS